MDPGLRVDEFQTSAALCSGKDRAHAVHPLPAALRGVRVPTVPRSPGAAMASCPSLCPPRGRMGPRRAPSLVGLRQRWGCLCPLTVPVPLGWASPAGGWLVGLWQPQNCTCPGLSDVARSSKCALFYVEMSPILVSGGAAFLLLLGRGTQPSPASAAHLVCVVLLHHKPEAPCSSPLLCQGPSLDALVLVPAGGPQEHPEGAAGRSSSPSCHPRLPVLLLLANGSESASPRCSEIRRTCLCQRCTFCMISGETCLFLAS